MVEIIKKVTINTINQDWLAQKSDDGSIVIDIVKESTNLYMNIVLACLFGISKEKSTVS